MLKIILIKKSLRLTSTRCHYRILYMKKVVKMFAEYSTQEEWLKYFTSLLTIKDYSADDIYIYHAEKVTLPLPPSTSFSKINIILIPEHFSKNQNANEIINELIQLKSEITGIILNKEDNTLVPGIEELSNAQFMIHNS